MNTTIVTCARPQEDYLASTVNYLLGQGVYPNIINGSSSQINLDKIPIEDLRKLQNNQANIVQLPCIQEDPGFMDKDIRYRHNQNYAAAFTMSPFDQDLLLLEDDVLPCQTLQEQFKCIEWCIKEAQLQHYIIALYHTQNFGIGPQELLDYPVEKFFGLQAIIYSAGIRELMYNYHLKYCSEQPADFITKIAVTENPEIKLLASRFSLFQHVGINTNGLGKFHQSSSFLNYP